MNLLLSTSSILLTLFNERAVKYCFEAVKWSIYTIYYYVYHDNIGIHFIIEKFLILFNNIDLSDNLTDGDEWPDDEDEEPFKVDLEKYFFQELVWLQINLIFFQLFAFLKLFLVAVVSFFQSFHSFLLLL